MKKVYLLLSGLSLSILSFAQYPTGVMYSKSATMHKMADEFVKPSKTFSTEKAAAEVLYSEDFDGSAGSWTTSGANGDLWLFDTDGPNGQFSSLTQIIQSPTASNGFMIFDADKYNTDTYGNNTANFEFISGNLESPIYDMSGISNATIQFYSQYRTCCSNTFYPIIQVTTDNFVNYVELDATVENVEVNDL
jgi:hypothetical protein